MKPRYMVNVVSPTCFQVACLAGGVQCLDTDSSGYQFNIFGITPEDFCSVVEEIEKWLETEHHAHMISKSWEIKAGQFTDKIIISHNAGGNISITRGNIKVLFYGWRGLIFSALPFIRKASANYNAKLDAELEDWSKEN